MEYLTVQVFIFSCPKFSISDHIIQKYTASRFDPKTDKWNFELQLKTVCVSMYMRACNESDMHVYTHDHGVIVWLHLFFSSSPLSALRAWLLAEMKLIQCLRSSGNSGHSICTQNWQNGNVK